MQNFADFQTYMQSIQRHWPRQTDTLAFRGLELAGETGEVIEKIKKVIRDQDGQLTDETRAALAKEMSDVLISLTNLATTAGLGMQQIADVGHAKMEARIATKTIQGSGDNREMVRSATFPTVRSGFAAPEAQQ